MRIDCGPTWSEKRKDQLEWQRRFAWCPTRTGPRECCWLTTIWRRRKMNFLERAIESGDRKMISIAYRSAFPYGFADEWEYRSSPPETD